MENPLRSGMDMVITETVLTYDPEQRAKWKRGALLDSLLPDCERHRSKYAGQCKTYHFGEVLTMQSLQQDRWSWAYENFLLFWKAGDPASYESRLEWLNRRRKATSVYASGTNAIAKVIGADAMERLWRQAERYRTPKLWATEPDLLAYRHRGGGYEFKAVEVKSVPGDFLKPGQRLGLALLRAILDCDVHVYRYTPVGKKVKPRTYGEGEPFEPI